MAMQRRAIVLGASVAGLTGLLAAAGIIRYRQQQQAPDGRAFDHERRLEAIAADYREGRVVAWHGWIMSATEAAALPKG